MKKLFIVVITTACFSAAPASAQAPIFNWSGFYVGVQGGWLWSEATATYGPSNPAATISGNTGQQFATKFDTAIFGGQIGYQHQFDRWVIGVEAGGTVWLGARTNRSEIPGSQVLCPKQTIALFNCSAYLNEIFTAGAKLGWSMGTWMPYIVGGYAGSSFAGEVRNLSLAPVGFPIIDWRERISGWYFGGGVDFAILPTLTLGIEYRHYDFGSKLGNAKATIGGIPDSPLPNDNANFKLNGDTLMARLNIKFAGGDTR